ncbi:cholecystokinin [Lampris incognitus]|uniref:cholecystokinin n=1 Tax=Lampris incognitus TaxID=2546036 RepID=UPI0024B534D8|nr:cholecystokinin [Lampris incognitus]
MNAGLCVCVLLAVLCTSCLGRPYSSQPLDRGRWAVSPPSEDGLDSDTHVLSEPRLRHTRSASQAKPLPLSEEEQDSRANLSKLLARLLSSSKGTVRRDFTVSSRARGLTAAHRIKDRDYTGWMDFGRRSAEEYEYSS